MIYLPTHKQNKMLGRAQDPHANLNVKWSIDSLHYKVAVVIIALFL